MTGAVAVRDPLYAQGVALTLFTSLVWSTTPLIFRAIETAGPWQIIFFRATAFCAGLTIVLLLRYRGAFVAKVRGIGRPGVLAACCLGSGSVFYIFALDHTTVANVAFVTSATPFLAAVLGWVVLREAVPTRTWACIGLAVGGVGLMMAEGIVVGGWLGNLMALGCASVSAVQVICLRRARGVDLWPSVLLAGFVAMGLSAPFVGEFTITWHDMALCALQGIVVSAFCNVLFTICARRVPAAELMLLNLTESVLSPFWVWLVLAEAPTDVTLVGGGIVLLAVVLQAMAALRASQRSRA